MKKLLKRTLQDIRSGQNIESYLVIGLILTIAILDIFDVSNESWITAITLAVLALLTYDRIQTKNSLEEVNLSLRAIKQDHSFEKSNELDILQINRRIESARTINWLAFTNEKTVNIFRSHISKCLSNGGEIRMLLFDSNGDLLKKLAKDDLTKTTNLPEYYKHGTGYTIWFCENILGNIKNGKIEIRILKTQPPYRMTMYNTAHENGYVRIHLLRPQNSKEAATIAWHREDDPDWFYFFADQFETLWNQSSTLPNRFQ